MPHPFDTLNLPSGGQFIFTPCPGTKGEPLAESLNTLKQAGATDIVTMLSDEELAFLGVADLGQQCEAAGLNWFQLPVEDDQGPQEPFFNAFKVHRDTLLQRLHNNATIVIHCRGGTGRTGMMAAILLLESGMDWETARSLIQSVRPKSLTIDSQVNFLQQHYQL